MWEETTVRLERAELRRLLGQCPRRARPILWGAAGLALGIVIVVLAQISY